MLVTLRFVFALHRNRLLNLCSPGNLQCEAIRLVRVACLLTNSAYTNWANRVMVTTMRDCRWSSDVNVWGRSSGILLHYIKPQWCLIFIASPSFWLWGSVFILFRIFYSSVQSSNTFLSGFFYSRVFLSLSFFWHCSVLSKHNSAVRTMKSASTLGADMASVMHCFDPKAWH